MKKRTSLKVTICLEKVCVVIKSQRLFSNNTCYFIGVVLWWLGTASIRDHVDEMKILNKF